MDMRPVAYCCFLYTAAVLLLALTCRADGHMVCSFPHEPPNQGTVKYDT